jgi:esterase/lipase superfamily enzyme
MPGRDYKDWWSERLGQNMRLVVWGHRGRPVLAFPSGYETDQQEEWEYEASAISAVADALTRDELKIYTVTSVDRQGFLNRSVSPAERALKQRLYDEYIRWEVIPFIREDTKDVPITTIGPAMGAYHALNSLLKHPDVIRGCCALSGTFDVRIHMDGHYNDDFYFNNPPDYLPNIHDPHILRHLRRCRVRLVTSSNEDAQPSYVMNDLMVAKGIDSCVDNWGLEGGSHWDAWARQLRKFLVDDPV